MAAHLREITESCQWERCTTIARVELRNTWNAVIGRFCKAHGTIMLRRHQQEHESKFRD